MATPGYKYFPDNYKEKEQELSDRNDILEKRFSERMDYWNKIYQKRANELIGINSKDYAKISKLVELETEILNVHESIRLEHKKLIRSYMKSKDVREDSEKDYLIFYEVRSLNLNIKSETFKRLLVEGLAKQRDRTCLLYESIIDYLDALKELFKSLKFKVKRTHELLNQEI